MNKAVIAAGLVASTQGVAGATTEVLASQDYMSSGFFGSTSGDFLRGEETGSVRGSHRATSSTIFGVTGETAYFGFDFDPTAFTSPIESAVFRVEVVGAGFFADPTQANPAEVSIHSLSADALSAIDQTLSGGPGSWLEFRDNEITNGSIVSTTSVDGLGVFDWDVTDLVNEWIANGDSNSAYTLGTSVLLDQDDDTAVAFVNSTWADLTTETTARLVIVPSPGTAAIFVTAGLVGVRRRR